MIRGLGIDLCQQDRFFDKLEDEKFLQKIFHPKELEAMKDKTGEIQKSAYLSARWAAKESLAKALGMGIFDIQMAHCMLHTSQGYPVWIFEESMKVLLEKQCVSQSWVSISYEANMVVAVTVLG
ncbi:MAG: holo-ACP synthase [Spirochaetia bacterium]